MTMSSVSSRDSVYPVVEEFSAAMRVVRLHLNQSHTRPFPELENANVYQIVEVSTYAQLQVESSSVGYCTGLSSARIAASVGAAIEGFTKSK